MMFWFYGSYPASGSGFVFLERFEMVTLSKQMLTNQVTVAVSGSFVTFQQ